MGDDVLNDNPEQVNLLAACAPGFTLTEHVKDALPKNGSFRCLNALVGDVAGCFMVAPTREEVQRVLESLERAGHAQRQYDDSPPYSALWSRKGKA